MVVPTTSPVTVLMAVFNGIPFLGVAIDSILAQTYRDFRFLIVDDCSTDNTREIIRSYNDDRIDLVCLEKNIGQTASLNVGLQKAATTWIARMDADDFSAPTRLEEQMERLESEPSLSCLGTFVWTFSDTPEQAVSEITPPLAHDDIKRFLLHDSPMIHGSIVMNRQAVLDVGSYNDSYQISADMDLYDRLLVDHRAANLPSKLLGIRRHAGQISRGPVALDENINIARTRLASTGYSAQELTVVRGALARCQIARGFHRASRLNLAGFTGDSLRAFRNSPKTFPYQWGLGLLRTMIPQRRQARLGAFLSGAASRLKTGR